MGVRLVSKTVPSSYDETIFNIDDLIVYIARVSSLRQDKTENPEKLINYLIKNKHWSPFEQASLTFEIVTSKAIAIQLLRHVTFRFQEFSQRYAVVENFVPFEIREQAIENRQSSTEVFNPIFLSYKRSENPRFLDLDVSASEAIKEFMELAKDLYKKLIDYGVAKECARMILPMCTETKLYMTGNIRSWIHFLELRDDSHAQKEAQIIAKQIKNIFISELPVVSKALGFEIQEDVDYNPVTFK